MGGNCRNQLFRYVMCFLRSSPQDCTNTLKRNVDSRGWHPCLLRHLIYHIYLNRKVFKSKLEVMESDSIYIWRLLFFLVLICKWNVRIIFSYVRQITNAYFKNTLPDDICLRIPHTTLNHFIRNHNFITCEWTTIRKLLTTQGQ